MNINFCKRCKKNRGNYNIDLECYLIKKDRKNNKMYENVKYLQQNISVHVEII